MVMQNGRTFFLIRKMAMKNDIFGISVGAYCIRPIKTAPKETYDQKSMYMWGVCNTPLLWRQKGSISKINFLVMQNGMILFLIWKRVMRNCMTFFLNRKIIMQNRLSLYLDRKRIRRKGKTIFLIWKMVMQNRLYLYLNRKRSMRSGRKRFLEHVFERYFWGTYFMEYFSLSQNESTPDLWWKSGVQNRKNLFEEIYSSSPLRMDALSENKQ